ncbi:MAG: cytochrome o ubiquinol oxidase subunit IV [Chlamydiales bacterium]|nr:cytochrome o ubiquinol oxidase subunit IV [Chlamydiia bacterium]MCP5507898.1 cytochrome o ubiquinol oxidase subunit IV [Chlamydiales bacterium]
MSEELSLREMQKSWHGSLKAYLIGFPVSVLLTAAAFSIGYGQFFSHEMNILVLCGLALVQAIVQLKYFLHLGSEGSPHWETFIFGFMLLILLIIVIGSLWVMNDLNIRTMTHPL